MTQLKNKNQNSLLKNWNTDLKIGVIICIFPIFGLSMTDPSGIQKLDAFDMTVVIRIIYFFISLLFAAKIVITKKTYSNNNIYSLLIFLYILNLCIPIIINRFTDFKSWYRFMEVLTISIIATYTIRSLKKQNTFSNVVLDIFELIRLIFWTILIIIAIVAIVKFNLVVYFSQGRGIRLGGSFIHPNTLSLGAVIYLISLYPLWIYKRISQKKFFLNLITGILVIIGTISSSGILILFFATSYILWTYISKENKILFSLLTIFILLILFQWLQNDFFLNLFQEQGTWVDRLRIYEIAYFGIKENIFFGVGPYEGVKDFLLIKSQSLLVYFIPPHPHNLFIELILGCGMILSIPFIIVLINIFIKSIMKISDNKYSLTKYLSLILLVILIHGQVESSIIGILKPFCHGYFLLVCSILSHSKNK